jgi:endonuclease/exonuclease/phosphatase family metal-dependent hydrolase
MKLTLATWNIRHGLGVDEKIDLSRTANIVRATGCDILFLQEVDFRLGRSDDAEQAREVAERLGMSHVFHANFGSPPQFGMGNAILSRSPLYFTCNKGLRYTGEPRGLLMATTEVANTQMTLMCTHWGLTAEQRVLQAEDCAAAVAATHGAGFIAGDWNCTPESPEFQYLTANTTLTDLPLRRPTYPMAVPTVSIDSILATQNVSVLRTKYGYTDASDHGIVVVEVEISPN